MKSKKRIPAKSKVLMQKAAAAHLSDILISVSKAEQEVWQHMDHIRLKKLPQHVTQHLKGKERSWTETNSWSVVSYFLCGKKSSLECQQMVASGVVHTMNSSPTRIISASMCVNQYKTKQFSGWINFTDLPSV